MQIKLKSLRNIFRVLMIIIWMGLGLLFLFRNTKSRYCTYPYFEKMVFNLIVEDEGLKFEIFARNQYEGLFEFPPPSNIQHGNGFIYSFDNYSDTLTEGWDWSIGNFGFDCGPVRKFAVCCPWWFLHVLFMFILYFQIKSMHQMIKTNPRGFTPTLKDGNE